VLIAASIGFHTRAVQLARGERWIGNDEELAPA
jgi:hypothetical protein